METDAAFLLRVLSDGKAHSLNEILQASFAERGCGLTVHSRAANLRAQGHTIIHETVKGAERGAGHTYRLVKPRTITEAKLLYIAAVPDGYALAFECVVDESAGMAEQMEFL